ncbi:M28 family metallopeptidase, partial [Streptomyces sp. UH6]|uniref:M28 family metallopeptidase n=1 Tax=Streptomyces sp. UH6 TaxID=2748379 RepID=UPI0015D48429
VYLAVPADVPVEDFHLPGARPGHTERLLPDPALLSRPGAAFAAGFSSPAGLRPSPGPETGEGSGEGFDDGLPSAEALAAVRVAVTPEVLREHTARFSGAEPLVEGDPLRVRSRHAATHDNMLVVRVLANRLQNLGLTVRLHPFTWRDHHLFTVEAEHTVAGSDATVLVTAHMDSTATGEDFVDVHGLPRPYDPSRDPAPGADDDASGTAAVLAAAACLRDLVAGGREPARSIRFVLFNAEEQGLVGSKFYARAAAAAGDPIAGVLQMDMIAGHQPGTRPVVEVHAGSAVPGPVVEASDALGGRVEQALLALAAEDPGGLGPKAQQLTGDADPAMGRSDHASFHERGYAAVAVSEDLFATPGGAEGTGTRKYHTTGDTVTDVDHDPDFATTVARAVTATALTLAGV